MNMLLFISGFCLVYLLSCTFILKGINEQEAAWGGYYLALNVSLGIIMVIVLAVTSTFVSNFLVAMLFFIMFSLIPIINIYIIPTILLIVFLPSFQNLPLSVIGLPFFIIPLLIAIGYGLGKIKEIVSYDSSPKHRVIGSGIGTVISFCILLYLFSSISPFFLDTDFFRWFTVLFLAGVLFGIAATDIDSTSDELMFKTLSYGCFLGITFLPFLIIFKATSFFGMPHAMLTNILDFFALGQSDGMTMMLSLVVFILLPLIALVGNQTGKFFETRTQRKRYRELKTKLSKVNTTLTSLKDNKRAHDQILLQRKNLIKERDKLISCDSANLQIAAQNIEKKINGYNAQQCKDEIQKGDDEIKKLTHQTESTEKEVDTLRKELQHFESKKEKNQSQLKSIMKDKKILTRQVCRFNSKNSMSNGII